MGKRDFKCTAWAMPTFSISAGKSPATCCRTVTRIRSRTDRFDGLVALRDESGNPKCANCMVHSGYEGSAVNYTFGSLKACWQTAKAMMNLYPDKGALDLLNEPVKPCTASIRCADNAQMDACHGGRGNRV